MKILTIDKSIDGGTGTFILNLLKIERLAKDVEMRVLVLEKPEFRNIKNPRFFYFRQKNFYPKKHSITFSNLANFFEEVYWLKRNIDEYKPEIVLGVDLRSNFLAIISKLFFFRKLKVIASIHINLAGTVYDKSIFIVSFVIKNLIRFLYEKADALVCVSGQLSKGLEKNFDISREIVTIYNGADYKTGKIRRLVKTKRKIVVTIARLVEQKDHINLITAFKLLTKKLPSVELWILSNGPKKNELKDYVNSAGMSHSVKFLGWVKNINTYLKKADIFAFSSKREGFAYVLLEAMSLGVPVVSTDTPYGPREVLDNGRYGMLVPVDDPTALEKAMFYLLTNRQEYMIYSRKSLERGQYFSTEKMVLNYNKLFLKLAKKT